MQPHDVAAVLAVAGLLGGAPAQADGAAAAPADAPARASGLMSFPGVTVERSTRPATVVMPGAALASRVYVDATTRRLRDRTPEDAVAEAVPDDADPSAEPDLLQGPDGIVGVRLDPRAATHAVVTRTDDGRLVGACVESSAAATPLDPRSAHAEAQPASPTPVGNAPASLPPASTADHDDAR